MKRICVFCGSSRGKGTGYIKAAEKLGRILAREGITLIYGGGKIGIMGHLAKSCLDWGGTVIGVIPEYLARKGLAYDRISKLIVVRSMHARKAKMAALSEAFIALPGGLGTIEEFFEMLTWTQLGLHRKPCGIVNTAHYYDKLMAFVEQMVERGFLEPAHRDMIPIDGNPARLLKKIERCRIPKTDKAAQALKKNGNVVP